MTDFPTTITDLGDKIANLKITEAVLLKDYLKEKYNIKLAAGGGMMPQAVAPVAPIEEKVVQTEFSVILEGLADPGKKISVIKAVREITQCGLNEGKQMVEGAPKPIKENISKEEAETVKKKLEEAGAKVSLK